MYIYIHNIYIINIYMLYIIINLNKNLLDIPYYDGKRRKRR